MQFIETYIRRKEGREEVTYRHPALEPILKDTYGIIVYQEQIIRIATDLAGYSSSEADLMRRAVAKKKAKDLQEQRAKFVDGATRRGIPRETADQIFDDIEYFANYGFNKAHSAAYAVITCQTAYLKAHYPVEYMAAMLSVERGNLEKVAALVAEARRLGIEVLPPDVNHSEPDFTIDVAPSAARGGPIGAIRYGLAAIKNVGEGPTELICQARGSRPFESVDDFCQRVDLRQINKRVLECLIKAGALDCLGTRARLLAALDRMFAAAQEVHAAREAGQLSLFGCLAGPADRTGLLALPDIPEVPQKDKLAWEKELLGLYLSQSPLHLLPVNLPHVTRASQVDETLSGRRIQVMGMVTGVHTIMTKKGELMAFVTVEDLSGSLEVVVFPRTLEETRELWTEDRLVVVKGRVEMRDERPSLVCDTAREYDPLIDADPAAMPPPLIATAGNGDLGADEALAEDPGDAFSAPEPPPEIEAPLRPAEPPLSAGRRHRLHLTFRRSGDDARDRQQLKAIYGHLTARPGDAEFYFYITLADRKIELGFPNATTAYSESLPAELMSRFGGDLISAEWAL
jgi:DNA polymerase-3 subunit alpha